MKRLYYYCSAVMLLTAISCSEDERINLNNPALSEIEISASKISSTGSDTSFADGDQIGVTAWIGDYSVGSEVAANAVVSCQNGVWKNSSAKLKWDKKSDEEYNFVAIYPQSEIKNIESVTISSKDYEMMSASLVGAESVKPSEGKVDLKFQHILSQVSIELLLTPEQVSDSIEVESIYFGDAIETSTVNLITGAVQTAKVPLSDVTMSNMADSVYFGYIIPQSANNLTINANSDSAQDQTYEYEGAMEFEAGLKYALQVSINSSNEIKLESMKSMPWNNNDDKTHNTTGPLTPDYGLPIISRSNYRTVTHELTSGSMKVGITDLGGGIINQITLDGVEIMGETSQRYGRACQLACRDQGHAGVYNPTQGGFYELLGTPSVLTQTDKKIVVEPRKCALWHGDGRFDFIEWENIGNDPYGTDGCHGEVGYGSDIDNIDESQLPGKQYDEVCSEFDYYGYYEDALGKFGTKVSMIYHYFELRYVRDPGHCISQFYSGKTKEGTLVVNPALLQKDLSVKYPEGVHAGTSSDMNGFIGSYDIRFTPSKWNAPYRYLQKTDGTWVQSDRAKKFRTEGTAYKYRILIAKTADEETSKAMCLYRPDSEINVYSTIGVNKSTGEMVYQDARPRGRVIEDSALNGLVVMGFNDWTLGILNPTRLVGKYANCYEAYRGEYYIMYGTTKEIKEALAVLDSNISIR